MSPTKACANDYYERTNDFYSSHLQHERERHTTLEQKHWTVKRPKEKSPS